LPGPTTLTPECDAFRQRFEALTAEAAALVAPLSDEQFAWQPAPDAWSVAQCIDHLNATARAYLPSLDEGIADAIRQGQHTDGPYRYNWVGRLMVYAMSPSTRFRGKAPQAFRPPEGRRRPEIMAAFAAYQVQYVDRLRQSSGLDLATARVTSPVARWLRVPLGSAFAMMVAHEQRHLAQARRVLEAAGFPR
jgi:uncharacterized damage-inducible protein DinB